MSGFKRRIAALERSTGIGSGEMEVHNSATCDEHLDRGEVCGNPEHGERCRISSRHRLDHALRIIRRYGACRGCLG